MRQLVQRRRKPQKRGAALVEFAVVTPLLLLILFGIIEFGQLFKVRQTAQHAAREACRIAVLQSTAKPYSNSAGPVMSRISQIMTAAGVPFNTGMVSITEDSTGDPTVSITVTVPYEDVKLTGYLGVITESVNGTCSMRKEGV
jgi:Flp pilus assembly protein TadG